MIDEAKSTQPELVRWPEQAALLDELRSRDLPRLVLIDEHDSVPDLVEALEDWVRLPVSADELAARIGRLAARATRAARRRVRPTLDEHGLFRVSEQFVALSPIEERLARALLDEFGSLVSYKVLIDVAWPAGRDQSALRTHVARLRRRVTLLGIAIRAVQSRGYVMDAAGAARW